MWARDMINSSSVHELTFPRKVNTWTDEQLITSCVHVHTFSIKTLGSQQLFNMWKEPEEPALGWDPKSSQELKLRVGSRSWLQEPTLGAGPASRLCLQKTGSGLRKNDRSSMSFQYASLLLVPWPWPAWIIPVNPAAHNENSIRRVYSLLPYYICTELWVIVVFAWGRKRWDALQKTWVACLNRESFRSLP